MEIFISIKIDIYILVYIYIPANRLQIINNINRRKTSYNKHAFKYNKN